MNSSSTPARKFPTGTLVFGLIMIVVALASLSRLVLQWSFDMPLFFITIVALAGVAMIFSGLAAAGKARKSAVEPPLPTDPNL